MSEQEKRGFPWLAAALVGLPLYVLSLGPAVWVVEHLLTPTHPVTIFLGALYYPLAIIDDVAGHPAWVEDYFNWWVNL